MIDRIQLEDRQQLEISFDGNCNFRPAVRRQKRLTRARWWFSQMRQVVNRAIDWEPAEPGRPEQSQFGSQGGRRSTAAQT